VAPAHGEAFIAAASNCRRCKSTPQYVPLAVHTAVEPAMTPAGIPQTRCVFCGQCISGCPPSQSFIGDVNARALLTLNYLAVARRHGAKIFPLHRVNVVRQTQGGFEIDIRVLERNTLEEAEELFSTGTLLRHVASTVRSAALRSKVLSFANICSIALRSGL
jgi:ferredoxin